MFASLLGHRTKQVPLQSSLGAAIALRRGSAFCLAEHIIDCMMCVLASRDMLANEAEHCVNTPEMLVMW